MEQTKTNEVADSNLRCSSISRYSIAVLILLNNKSTFWKQKISYPYFGGSQRLLSSKRKLCQKKRFCWRLMIATNPWGNMRLPVIERGRFPKRPLCCQRLVACWTEPLYNPAVSKHFSRLNWTKWVMFLNTPIIRLQLPWTKRNWWAAQCGTRWKISQADLDCRNQNCSDTRCFCLSLWLLWINKRSKH